MADLDVTCSRCGATLQHECRPETLEEAALALFMWRPESGFPRALKRGNDDCDGSEDEEAVPFLTESFLYPLLGKSDARSLMSRIHGVFEAMGVEPRAFEQKAWDRLEQKKRDKEEERRAREAARRRYREEMSPVARVKQKSGFALCRYRSFYCFDVNVAECADGDCFEREDSKFKVKRKAPKLGAVVVKAGGMGIELRALQTCPLSDSRSGGALARGEALPKPSGGGGRAWSDGTGRLDPRQGDLRGARLQAGELGARDDDDHLRGAVLAGGRHGGLDSLESNRADHAAVPGRMRRRQRRACRQRATRR